MDRRQKSNGPTVLAFPGPCGIQKQTAMHSRRRKGTLNFLSLPAAKSMARPRFGLIPSLPASEHATAQSSASLTLLQEQQNLFDLELQQIAPQFCTLTQHLPPWMVDPLLPLRLWADTAGTTTRNKRRTRGPATEFFRNICETNCSNQQTSQPPNSQPAPQVVASPARVSSPSENNTTQCCVIKPTPIRRVSSPDVADSPPRSPPRSPQNNGTSVLPPISLLIREVDRAARDLRFPYHLQQSGCS